MAATTEYHAKSVAKPPNRSFSSNFSETPEALTSIPRWMGTRFVVRKDGKKNKPPYRVVSGLPVIKADKTNPENWATYADALAAYERGEVDAIGYVFSKDDPNFVVDCDSIIDTDTGELDPTAAEVIHALKAYTELSCSGTGVHIIASGTKPDYARCKSDALGFDIEVYDSARFVVLTGQRITEVTGLQPRQRELDELCQRLWPKKPRNFRPVADSTPVALDDQELLECARRSRTGARFRKLYDAGDTAGYASASEADYALLNALIFWTAGERERIIRLFESSALYRQKGKYRGYVERSVDSALSSYVGSFYRPRSVSKARHEEQSEPDPLTPYLEVLLNPSLWIGRRGASAYKAFAGAVILAAEDGIVDDDGNLRIGCDIRRLAEAAGTSFQTLSRSALPYLMQQMKLLRWRRGKGRQAGLLILLNPRNNTSANNKVSTHFFVRTYVKAEHALETLRLLIRMRSGNAKTAKLLRLGMPAMFVTIALATTHQRGYNITELVERTGRRKTDLRHVLTRLKAAGIAREVSSDVYRLTDDFAAAYERVLRDSGITYSEREQRRRHDDDRKRRDAKLGVEKRRRALRGKEHMRRVVAEREAEDRDRSLEEQRRKVGTTAATFLADELSGVRAMRFASARQRWIERGGATDDLRRAIHTGAWRLYREVDGDLYVERREAS